METVIRIVIVRIVLFILYDRMLVRHISVDRIRTFIGDKQPIGTSSHTHPLEFTIISIDEHLSMSSPVTVRII